MTANETTIESPSPHPAASQPSRGRLIFIWLLYAALAVQVAAWVAVALTTRDIGAAFTKPHPGFRDEVVLGGGIWLIQFALVVLVFGRKARAGAHTDSHVTHHTAAA
jgi:hypothetical protein